MSIKVNLSKGVNLEVVLPESVIDTLFYNTLMSEIDYDETSIKKYLSAKHGDVVFTKKFVKEKLNSYVQRGLVREKQTEGKKQYWINDGNEFWTELLSGEDFI